jgi:GNAT superfamily N-acetyltransferase
VPQTEIVPLDPSQIPEAAGMLARAFFDDPLQAYYFPDPSERLPRAQAVFAMLLRYCLRYGEAVVTAGPIHGVGAWIRPGEWEWTPERAAEIGLMELPAQIGEEAAQKMLGTHMALLPFHHSEVPKDHWYGVLGGVAPEARGRWLGRALLEPLCRRVDESGLCSYLETCNPVSMTLYTRGAGFRMLRDIVEPESGIRFWLLVRDVRSGAAAGTVRAQRPPRAPANGQ